MAKLYQEANEDGSIVADYPFTDFNPKDKFDEALALFNNLQFTSMEIASSFTIMISQLMALHHRAKFIYSLFKVQGEAVVTQVML